MPRPGDARHAGPRAGTARHARHLQESGIRFSVRTCDNAKWFGGGATVSDDFKALIAKAATGAPLTREEAAQGFDRMMSGEATPSQMGGLLMALRVRGETVEEITGAVTVMREKMLRGAAPPDAIDVVGTGGDASGSFNISTCAAFIVAGAAGAAGAPGPRAR